MSSLGDRWDELIDESIAAREAMRGALAASLEQACDLTLEALRNEKKLLLIGNGGSAADAQHMAAEFVGRFKRERRAWPALALSENVSSLTGIGNDYSYERVFARQLEAFGAEGDVLVALTTSGTSPNILAGLEMARSMGVTSIVCTGATDNPALALATVPVPIPAPTTASIQEGYMLFLHAFCEHCEAALPA